MAFDPDTYLAQKSSGSQASSFDPDAYLAQKEPMTAKGAGKNLLMDAGRNAMSAIDILKRGPTGAGYTGKTLDPKEAYAMLQGMKDIPGQMLNEVQHPIKSLYEKPISTALDFATLGEGGLSLANAARPLAEGAANRIVPGLLKSTAGVPEMATERAIARPEILKTPATAPEDVGKVVGEPIINAIQSAKTRVQGILGKAYQKYAGLVNPIDEFINGRQTKAPVFGQHSYQTSEIIPPQEERNIASGISAIPPDAEPTVKYGSQSKTMVRDVSSQNPQSITIDDLREKYKSAMSGDLLKKRGTVGEIGDLSNKEQLGTLSNLKREIQSHINFNKDPITLRPIDSVKDASLKKMAGDIDSLRESLPNGKRLSAVDNAYKAINDIYDTVQKDLSDPGKAKDTMMRLLRGDNTWLTSGRMGNKVSAIRKAELMTGQKVLEPALDELTRQVFSEWTGKGFTSQVLRGAAGAGGMAGLFLHNPAAIPAVAGTMAMSSPRVMGAAIRGTGAVGEGIGAASAAMQSPAIAGAFRSWMDSLKHKGDQK